MGAVSISSEEETDDDATEDEGRPYNGGHPLYTKGNGVLYVNDVHTGIPTNRVVADLAFAAKTQHVKRFYVVTVGNDVGIFDNVYVFILLFCLNSKLTIKSAGKPLTSSPWA